MNSKKEKIENIFSRIVDICKHSDESTKENEIIDLINQARTELEIDFVNDQVKEKIPITSRSEVIVIALAENRFIVRLMHENKTILYDSMKNDGKWYSTIDSAKEDIFAMHNYLRYIVAKHKS